jgi:hypothetical protein
VLRGYAICPALAALVFLNGCGLAHQDHSVRWSATLDRRPDSRCVQDALGALPEIFRIDFKELADRYVLGVYLKPPGQSDAETRENKAKMEAEMKRSGVRNYRDWPDIYVIAAGRTFQMNYRGWPPAGDPREIAANEIIQKLAAVCGIPELSSRAKEDHRSEWMPYAFNI